MMKSRVFALLMSLLSASTTGAAPEFACIVTAERTTYEVGEVPSLAFSVVNQSKQDVVFVGSLDGSTEGMRYPKCHLEIVDGTGKSIIAPYGRCGNMNPLRVEDFVLIPKGQSFDPFGEGFFQPPALFEFPVTIPGDYIIRFHYSTSDRIQDYLPDESVDGKQSVSREIKGLFKRVPKVDLVSNELKLTFIPKSK